MAADSRSPANPAPSYESSTSSKAIRCGRVPSPQGLLRWPGAATGKLLAVGCDDLRIYVFDLVRDRLTSVLEGHRNGVVNVFFSHSGELLFSHAWDQTTRVWDPVEGTSLTT